MERDLTQKTVYVEFDADLRHQHELDKILFNKPIDEDVVPYMAETLLNQADRLMRRPPRVMQGSVFGPAECFEAEKQFIDKLAVRYGCTSMLPWNQPKKGKKRGKGQEEG